MVKYVFDVILLNVLLFMAIRNYAYYVSSFIRCVYSCSVSEYILIMLQGDTLRVKVNKLASTKTQLPYSYYSIPYCRPHKIVDSAENLGEVLRGDRIENSPYEVRKSYIWSFFFIMVFCYAMILITFLLQFQMRTPQMCNVVCRVVLDEKKTKEFKEKIDDEYRVNM